MTIKPKTRKTPAKRTAPKAATKQAPGAQISEICGLIARWRFLEAEEVYLAEISPDEESVAAFCKHQREQDEIETKLSRSIPQDFRAVRELLEFAADMIKKGDRPDHGGEMMLGKILESLPEIFSGETEAARNAGMDEMRRTLNFVTENARRLLEGELAIRRSLDTRRSA
jgi:hypothetical protein